MVTAGTADPHHFKILSEPVVGSRRPLEMLALPGIERLRAYIDRQLDLSPLEHLLGLRTVSVKEGEATYTLPVGPWLEDAYGGPGLGVLAVIADGAWGGAIQTILPPGFGMATVSLWLASSDAVPRSGLLTAHGVVTRRSSTIAVAEGTVVAPDGHEVARGMTRCMMLPAATLPTGSDPNALPEATLGRPPRDLAPPPYERIAEGGGLNALIGMQRVEESEVPGVDGRDGYGAPLMTLPASPWFTSPAGSMQGGVGAWLAERAFQAAMAPESQPGERFRTDEMTVTFLRPVLLGDGELSARARLRHRGRSRASAEIDVCGPNGKLMATATAGAAAPDDS